MRGDQIQPSNDVRDLLLVLQSLGKAALGFFPVDNVPDRLEILGVIAVSSRR